MNNQRMRYHYFDSLRAWALLLGIPIHASLAYVEVDYYWLIKDTSTNVFIDIILDFLRLFRMPLFFIISGFFSAMTIHQKDFLIKRVKRLLYPLITFFFILIVPTKAIFVAIENHQLFYSGDLILIFKYTIKNFFAESTAEHYRHGPNWGHLWFLMYLFIFSFFTDLLKKRLKINVSFKSLLISCVSLTFLSYSLMESHWVDRPFHLLPIPSLFLYYGVFYIFGLGLYTSRSYQFSQIKSLMLLSVGIILALARAFIEVSIHLKYIDINGRYMLLNFWSTLSTWTIILGAIFYFKNKVIKESKIMRYLVDASYYIYLIHLPIIIILNVIFFKIYLSSFSEFLLINIITLSLSLVTWEYIVKDSFIDKFLKGQLI